MKLKQIKKFYDPFFVGYNKYDLAIYRILFFALMCYFFGFSKYFVWFNLLPPEMWEPNGVLDLLNVRPLRYSDFSVIFGLWQAALVFCVFGLFFRWVGPLCFFLGLYISCQGHSYGYQTHNYMPVFLATLPICFSRASDVFSLDYLFFKEKLKKLKVDESEYSWPIRSVQFVFCLVFFSAGISKVLHGGIDWVTSDTLRNYFMRAYISYFDVNTFATELRVNEWLYQHPLVCNLMAAVTVVVECASIFAFYSKRYAKMIVPMIFFFQVGIIFTIFVNFIYYIIIYLAWIPWSKLFKIDVEEETTPV